MKGSTYVPLLFVFVGLACSGGGASTSIAGSGGASEGGRLVDAGGSTTGGVPQGSGGGSLGEAGANDSGMAGAGPSGTGDAGQAGSGPGSGALHVTLSRALPASQLSLVGLLLAVDSNDGAVVVGPSANSFSTDPGPSITWFPRTGTSRTRAFTDATTPAALALDLTDSIWLAGQLYRSVSFAGPTLQPIDNGYYLVKLAADGSHLLSIAVPQSDVTTVQGITTDAAGNAYVVGGLLRTDGTLGSSAFVTKFSATGAQLYQRTFIGADIEASAQSIAVTPNGEVVIAGFFNSSLTLGSNVLTSQGGLASNGFVAILDAADGSAKSAFSFGGTVADVANSVQLTHDGHLRVSGTLTGSSSIGGKSVDADAAGSGFVADLSQSGVANWLRLLDGQSFVARADTSGMDLTFAAGDADDGTSQNAIVASVGANAALTLLVRSPNNDGNGATSVAADRHGGAWVGGEFQGTVDFGLGVLSGADPTLPTNFVLHIQP
jgi:hypothetical protein